MSTLWGLPIVWEEKIFLSPLMFSNWYLQIRLMKVRWTEEKIYNFINSYVHESSKKWNSKKQTLELVYHFDKRKGVWISRDDNLEKWLGNIWGKLIEDTACFSYGCLCRLNLGATPLSLEIRAIPWFLAQCGGWGGRFTKGNVRSAFS